MSGCGGKKLVCIVVNFSLSCPILVAANIE